MMIEFFEENRIEIIGAIVGLLYLYFEYKAHILMWLTGIIMSSFYTIVFIQATFYAFACINVYYILAGIYGWIIWYKPQKQQESTSIGILRTPTRLYLPILLSIIIIYAVILYALATFTDSQVLYGDSFVTTLSIVAMWMLARKYAEQWLLLIVVNIVSVFLYLYQDLYPTSIMYLVYAVVSVFGYLRWKRMVINAN